MNHVRQAPESHGTASLEAPVINKSVKKKQNVKLQQPNLKEIYHRINSCVLLRMRLETHPNALFQ
jgi:hypothetical protein